MRMEMIVDLGANRKKQQADQTSSRPPGQPSSREKQLYWLALALHIEELIISGEQKSYAEVSRSCRVSRARITTLMAIFLPL